ncbi:hypothetical protein BJ741DRAFT_330308 [Chytriomyces cf. hyalinus JEL632]|nr:hypothetical protein BJ741DRAFT_330308 [Chytriomyces cf. hyalinus JEL632]
MILRNNSFNSSDTLAFDNPTSQMQSQSQRGCVRWWVDAPGPKDPYFFAISAIHIPIYILGLFLNGSLFVLMRRRIQTRLDRTLLLLVAVHTAWALFELLRYTISIWYGPQVFWRVVAAGTSIGLICIFAANMCLSFERCFFVRFSNLSGYERATQKYFVFLAVWVSVLVVTVVAIYSTSCTDKLMFPTARIQRTIWTATVGTSGILIMLMTIAVNLSTYRHVSLAMKTSLLGTTVATEPLERKVLVRCIIMSSGLIICYVPIILFMGITLNMRLDTEVYRNFRIVSYFAASMDVIITPVLLVYLHRDVQALIWRCVEWWRGNRKGVDMDGDGKLVNSISLDSVES